MADALTLIAAHDLADFDALASQVAATKLYPGSVILESPSVGREVHPYLALHRDRFSGLTAARVSWGSVRRLIVVDVRRRSRLAHVAPLLERRDRDPSSLELLVYDHHPAHPDDVRADVDVVEPVGSTTTLLTERIARAGIALDPVEATLLALGLHADTGSLSFVNTTARDARALAHLLEAGVDVSLLTRYLHRPLDSARRDIMAAVLRAAESHSAGGLSVGISSVSLAKAPSGLDEVTTRAHDSLACPALFVIYALPARKVQLIARSRSRSLDVAAVLAELGGGGHASAGAASLKNTTRDQVHARLLAALGQHAPAALTARDLMSSPVHTVSADAPLREVARSLAARGHSGVCVLRDQHPIAVISRSDLLRAEQLGQLELEVKSNMSSRLITAPPDAALESLVATMEQHDIGRLPILDAGRLIGIVTRSDVRRALYASSAPAPGTP